jgi:hypothetical protein
MILTVVGKLLIVLLVFSARIILIGAMLAAATAAWGYYGYQQIACHPMFSSSSNVECESVQALSAEHSLAIVKVLAPYQQVLQIHQVEIALWAAVALVWAIVIEVAVGIFAIWRKKRAKRDLFKAATAVKEKTD